jgi:transposase
MKWPARSPDLNPIENLWGIVSRSVYAGGRQYANVRELKSEILRCWENIPNQVIQNLILSMNKRVFEVIKNSGKGIKYLINQFEFFVYLS